MNLGTSMADNPKRVSTAGTAGTVLPKIPNNHAESPIETRLSPGLNPPD
jgi:hypothetical protein